MQSLTTLEQFTELYESRIRSTTPSHVNPQDLQAHPTVQALRQFPPEVLATTAPDQLSRCRVPLTAQLQQWLRNLKTTHSHLHAPPVESADADIPTASTLHRRQAHCLSYWNASGFGRGLRRWG